MNNKRKLFQFCLLCAAVLVLPTLVQAQYLYTTNADNTLTITDYNGASSVAVVPGSFNSQLVTGISDGAFEAGMYSILIPASITNIMDYAFALNPYLTNVTFEGNAPSADPTVFYGDTTLTVYYMAGTTGWGSRFDGLPTAPSAFSFAIQNGSVTITGYTGASGPLTIPAVIFELPVTAIAGNSFDEDLGNTSPTSITITNNVTSLEAAAFREAYALATVSIGSGVTNMGGPLFLACSALNTITVDPQNAFFSSSNGVLFDKSQTVLIQYPEARMSGSYTIPRSVSSIASAAFEDCGALTNVVIPDGVTNIGGAAFELSGLTSLIIPSSVTTIGSSAFSLCTSLINMTIPVSATNIGADAFEACSFGHVTIPNGVTSIGYMTFDDCEFLTNITIPNSVTSIGDLAFYNCSHLSGIYFQGNAPAADPGAFIFDNASTYYLLGTTGWDDFSTATGLPVVLWNPMIQTNVGSFGVQRDQFGFNITGTNNYTMVVEACSNLANPVWIPLQTCTLTNGSFYFTDPQWTNYACRFYGLGFP